jgi:hypothetical protein
MLIDTIKQFCRKITVTYPETLGKHKGMWSPQDVETAAVPIINPLISHQTAIRTAVGSGRGGFIKIGFLVYHGLDLNKKIITFYCQFDILCSRHPGTLGNQFLGKNVAEIQLLTNHFMN